MKIEVLFFEGCPHHAPVVDLVREVAGTLGVEASIAEVEVDGPEQAVRLRFHGSPSVHVNAIDIDPSLRESNDFAFGCRTYDGAGMPSREMIETAIHEAMERKSPGRGRSPAIAVGGSVFSAIAASACCWIPLLAIAFGASAGGASALFERWRPWLIAVSLLSLTVGFYSVYFRRQPDSCCESGARAPRRRSTGVLDQAILWSATLAVVAIIFFPKWGHVLVDGGEPALSAQPASMTRSVTVAIEGMTCDMCAAHVARELRGVPGVLAADASYAQGSATLTIDEASAPASHQLAAAVARAGYQMKSVSPGDSP